MTKPLTSDQKVEIKWRYGGGERVQDLAIEYKTSERTLYDFLLEKSVPSPKPPPKEVPKKTSG